MLEFTGFNPDGWDLDDVTLHPAILENSSGAVIGASFADPDAGSDPVTVTYSVASGLLSANAAGNVSIDHSGSTAVTLNGSVADINAFIAAGDLTYTPPQDFTGAVDVTITIDDLGHNGSGGPLTATTDELIYVAPVNHAPVMQAASPTLPTLNENDANPASTSVASLLQSTVTDADPAAVQGIAITGDVAAHGTWQYSLDGGATWTGFGTLSIGNALLLQTTDLVRFTPDGTGAGTETFDYAAWDQTSGTPGGFADVTQRGDSTAFSTEIDTASLVIRANHAPVIGSSTDTGSVASAGLHSTNGTIAFTDADPSDSHTATFIPQDNGYLGAFSVDPNATELNGAGSFGWQFSVNPTLLSQFSGLITQSYTVTVDDGHGGTAQDNVTVTLKGINLAPVVTTDPTLLQYTETHLPVAIDPTLHMSDADDTTLVGATVAITGNFLAGHDALGFTAQHGITGSYNATSGVLTLSGTASVADYQDALRSVTYFDSNDPPIWPGR